MRSTVFIILSLMVHGMVVTAVVLSPQRLSESNRGTTVEVTTGNPSDTPGVNDADKASATPPPPVKAEEPVAKVTPPKAKRVAAKAKPAPAPVAKQEPPEKLDPEIAEEPTPAKEEPVLKPVQESAPQGVEAAQATDKETEATSTDEKKSADPSPVGVSESTPAAAYTQELGHGGATQAGAVEYTDLKQANGNHPPVYPLAARREKRQGQVELLYRVTKEGTVADISIAQSSGSTDLDNEAVRAVSKFHFVPGQEGWAKHPVLFSLKGETASLPSKLRTKVGGEN